MIVKDDSEEKSLRRGLNTVAPFVDAIYITTTAKPNKKIIKLCKEYGAVHSYFEWVNDFSKARNFNFAQVPQEYEWIFWMDADDILQGGKTLREAVALAENNNIKSVFARYLYQVDADEKGNIKEILIEHLRERLIRNDGTYEWVAPIHETLIEKVPSSKTDFQGFVVIHLSDYSRMLDSMMRNIFILQEEVMKNPQDPRPIYYLAKAYFDTEVPDVIYNSAGEGLDSITMELLKDYLRKSGWAEERAQAWEYLSMIHRERGEYKKAIQCLFASLSEWPAPPSVYIQLSLCYVMLKDWSKAEHWVKLASNVDIPKTTLVINPRDYKTMVLEALYHISINTGQLDQAERVVEGLVNLLPTDVNVQRYKEIKQLKHYNNIAHWTTKLAYHLKETGQYDKLRALVYSIPQEIANEPALMDLRNTFIPPRVWDENEVAIYCGPGWEKWSPKNASKGIGGSEEAVIYLSKELVKLGWKVTVFADPQEDEGVYDGVSFVPHYHVNWQDTFNILISWRQVGLFDLPVKAKKTYLWNHDIQNPMEYTEERVKKIDKVMFLSKWHRENVPALPESKIFYTANGINL